MSQYDVSISLSPVGSFQIGYSANAQKTLGETIPEVWSQEEVQRIRLWCACSGLKCSSYAGNATVRQLLEERGLHDEIGLIKSTQPAKLDMVVDDLAEAVINLDWSLNRKRFEELFSKVGGSYGGD